LSARLSYDFVKREIEKTGYILLSTEYINGKQKLKLECPNGHEYINCYRNFIYSGNRCATCVNISLNERYSHSYDHVKNKIEEVEGYKLISDSYVNSNEKLEIRCPNGHLFFMPYKRFVNCDNRCPYCQNKKVMFDDVVNAFESQDFYLLSKDSDYKANTTKLAFVCNQHSELGIQHIDYAHVKRGQGCFLCYKEKISGENSILWKGGVSSKNNLIRGSMEYRRWRTEVFKRDVYTCQCCGNSISDKLQVHHIDNFAEHAEKRLIHDNGITLCGYCHNPMHRNSFHYIYGTRNNNSIQLQEYIHNVITGIVVPIHILEGGYKIINIDNLYNK